MREEHERGFHVHVNHTGIEGAGDAVQTYFTVTTRNRKKSESVVYRWFLLRLVVRFDLAVAVRMPLDVVYGSVCVTNAEVQVTLTSR